MLHWTKYLQMQVLVVEDLHNIKVKWKNKEIFVRNIRYSKENFVHIYMATGQNQKKKCDSVLMLTTYLNPTFLFSFDI